MGSGQQTAATTAEEAVAIIHAPGSGKTEASLRAAAQAVEGGEPSGESR